MKKGEVENKIPDVSVLTNKTYYKTKMLYIEKKYFTTSDYNKFRSKRNDAKIKEMGLFNKFDFSNLLKNSDLSTKFKD